MMELRKTFLVAVLMVCSSSYSSVIADTASYTQTIYAEIQYYPENAPTISEKKTFDIVIPFKDQTDNTPIFKFEDGLVLHARFRRITFQDYKREPSPGSLGVYLYTSGNIIGRGSLRQKFRTRVDYFLPAFIKKTRKSKNNHVVGTTKEIDVPEWSLKLTLLRNRESKKAVSITTTNQSVVAQRSIALLDQFGNTVTNMKLWEKPLKISPYHVMGWNGMIVDSGPKTIMLKEGFSECATRLVADSTLLVLTSTAGTVVLEVSSGKAWGVTYKNHEKHPDTKLLGPHITADYFQYIISSDKIKEQIFLPKIRFDKNGKTLKIKEDCTTYGLELLAGRGTNNRVRNWTSEGLPLEKNITRFFSAPMSRKLRDDFMGYPEKDLLIVLAKIAKKEEVYRDGYSQAACRFLVNLCTDEGIKVVGEIVADDKYSKKLRYAAFGSYMDVAALRISKKEPIFTVLSKLVKDKKIETWMENDFVAILLNIGTKKAADLMGSFQYQTKQGMTNRDTYLKIMKEYWGY